MQSISYFFGTAPAAPPVEAPDWSLLFRAQTETKVIEFLDSKNHNALFTLTPDGKYFDHIHPINEEIQVRLVKEVPGWSIREGNIYGSFTIYPEKVLLACLETKDAEAWISTPGLLTKQAKRTEFIVSALKKFPELVLGTPQLLFKVEHEVFHSEPFARAIAKYGGDILFEQDEDGYTFLFCRFLTEETVSCIFHALGRKDFGRLITTRNNEGEHFAYTYTVNPETIIAVLDALPEEERVGFVTASSKKGNLFTKTPNGKSKAVEKWIVDNGIIVGRTTRAKAKSKRKTPAEPGISGLTLNPPTEEMWDSRSSPKI